MNFFISIFSLSKQMVNQPPIFLPPFLIPKSKKHSHFGKLLGHKDAFVVHLIILGHHCFSFILKLYSRLM